MELLAVSGAVLSTIQIARDAARLLRAVSDIDDPRIRLIQGKLTNEKRLTVAWANRIRLESANGWDVPPESAHEVEKILQQMQMYFERAENKMVKILKEPGGRMTTRVFVHRFWFASHGFEELRDLTDALATMNQTLILIAPPLPQYSSLNIPTRVQPGPTTVSEASGIPADITESDLPISQLPGESLANLYSKCLDVLAFIAREMSCNETLRTLHTHLEQWGQGLFVDDSISLNTIFNTDPEDFETLLAAITRGLVYVAILEEQILAYIHWQETEGRRGIENKRTEINAMLGQEAFVEVALANWFSLQATSVDSSASRNICPIQEETEGDTPVAKQHDAGVHGEDMLESKFEPGVDANYLEDIETETKQLEIAVMKSITQTSISKAETLDTTSSDLVRLQVSEKEEVKPDAVKFLRRIIELLFDLLPAIRSVRRARLLEIESNETPLVLGSTQMSESGITKKLNCDEQLDLTIEKIGELETLLKNDESWAKENGQQVKIYTPILSKERERLEEYKQARKRRKGTSLDDDKVLSAITKLYQQLSKTTQDIEVKGSQVKGKEGLHIKDMKFSDVDTDRIIRNAVDKIVTTTTGIWDDLPLVVS